jgi:hypothetical protein
MFLCDRCLDKFCTADHPRGSRGPCEHCGIPSWCHDCHHGTLFRPPLKPAKAKTTTKKGKR